LGAPVNLVRATRGSAPMVWRARQACASFALGNRDGNTMTAGAASVAIETEAPVGLADADRFRILAYLSVLIMLMGFGAPFGGLIDVPISFFLKNKLHLQAHEVATFRLVSSIPLYLSIAFGFLRDSWSPFGIRDRGYMILFGAISAIVYVYFAFSDVTYVMLLAAVFLLTTAFLFVASAQAGLTSAIGQQHVMSGQVSTIWNIFQAVPVLAAYFAGGFLSDALEGRNANEAARILFLVGAAIMIAIALYGVWRPRVVFDNVHEHTGPKLHPITDLKRLGRHWPIYPALMIYFMWSFAPGSATPLQYYLQNTLHSNDAQWGEWNAIFTIAFIPTYMLFGYLCRRYPLRTLLFWGTIVGVPQYIPLLFMHSAIGALIVAAPIGLMGGVATAAYTDLLIRSCPPGLQGTVLMMAFGLYYVAGRFGDVLGTSLYDYFGTFTVCVIAITVTYALMLPMLLLVPKHLIATPDGAEPLETFG
jgi:Na+/melibiose symporter-like transporter